MSLGTILLIVLIVLLVGAFPGWGHEGFGYGYRPLGGVFFVLVIVLILVLMGRL